MGEIFPTSKNKNTSSIENLFRLFSRKYRPSAADEGLLDKYL